MKKYSITVNYKVDNIKYSFTTIQEGNSEQGVILKLLNTLVITGEITKIKISEITY